MNERTKELAEQAGLACESSYGLYPLNNDLNRLERFAELIRQDEREQISHTYLKLTLEAVLREREANAKLCEEFIGEDQYDMFGNDLAEQCSTAIRQRGEK